jgi:uncharacterized protein YigA (DUF484 family)
MMTVEREIGSIESANNNKETLDAMKNASNAIKSIHGGLTVDQVDQTMEDLREQHAVGEEIAEALTQGAGPTGVDEDELDEELAELQQEQLDERMLKTGSVPVSDQIQRMPSAPSKCLVMSKWKVTGGVANFRLQQRTLYLQRRKTRRPSCGNYRPRWPCEQRHFIGSSRAELLHFWVRAGSIYFVVFPISVALLCHSRCEMNRYHIIHIHEHASLHAVQFPTHLLQIAFLDITKMMLMLHFIKHLMHT